MVQKFCDLIVSIKGMFLTLAGGLLGQIRWLGESSISFESLGNLAGSPGGKFPTGTVLFPGNLVGGRSLAFCLRLPSPCFLLLILHFEKKVGTLYLGDVEFLPRMTPIGHRSGFDGSPLSTRLTVSMC